MSQADERDVIFARMGYAPGTAAHKDYYTRNPQRLEVDEELRKLPLMGDGQSTFHHPLLSPLPDACFDFLTDIRGLVTPPVASIPQEVNPQEGAKLLQGLARYYGAKLVSIVDLQGLHYSHKGRPLAQYGQVVDPGHPFGIVFAVEMAEDLIDTAPNLTQSVATTKGYMDAAIIGMVLAYYIASLGYSARNHMDGNYLFPLPAVAQAGGLGEIGLNGLLITPEFGPRVRLGLVTTTLPLPCTTRKPLGIRTFCDICQRCKLSCPGKAIDNQELGNQFGFYDSGCLTMWQRLGTDCGVCLSACPFSHHLPTHLIADLTTSEHRNLLAEHCNEHFKLRPYRPTPPQWLQIPKPDQSE